MSTTPDLFWMESPSALLNNLTLLPDCNMSKRERLNAITRLLIVVSVILFLLSGYQMWLTVFITGLVVIFLLYNFNIKNHEGFSFPLNYNMNMFPQTFSRMIPQISQYINPYVANFPQYQLPSYFYPPVVTQPSPPSIQTTPIVQQTPVITVTKEETPVIKEEPKAEPKGFRANIKKLGLVGEKIIKMPSTGFKINPFTVFRKRF